MIYLEFVKCFLNAIRKYLIKTYNLIFITFSI